MTYELRFENHDEPVEVMLGYGFKAPKSWGRVIPNPSEKEPRPVFENDTVDPLGHLDQRIDEEQSRLDEMCQESESVLASLRHELFLLGINELITPGIQASAQLREQQDFKIRQIKEVQTKTKTEMAEQRGRIERLKTLRSRKRKDLV